MAMTLMNLGIFYLQAVPERERSLACAREALVITLPFYESVPAVQNYVGRALAVAEAWGEDRDVFIGEAIKVFALQAFVDGTPDTGSGEKLR